MSPAALPLGTAPAPERVPGVCRICGCTPEEGCLLEVDFKELRYETCSWAEVDLCSRCHGPKRPTACQAGEIERIRDRHGPVRVTRGRGRLQLEVALIGNSDLGKHFVVRPAVLTLDRSGRIVHRLAREVTPTNESAVRLAEEERDPCRARPSTSSTSSPTHRSAHWPSA